MKSVQLKGKLRENREGRREKLLQNEKIETKPIRVQSILSFIFNASHLVFKFLFRNAFL